MAKTIDFTFSELLFMMSIEIIVSLFFWGVGTWATNFSFWETQMPFNLPNSSRE